MFPKSVQLYISQNIICDSSVKILCYFKVVIYFVKYIWIRNAALSVYYHFNWLYSLYAWSALLVSLTKVTMEFWILIGFHQIFMVHDCHWTTRWYCWSLSVLKYNDCFIWFWLDLTAILNKFWFDIEVIFVC